MEREGLWLARNASFKMKINFDIFNSQTSKRLLFSAHLIVSDDSSDGTDSEALMLGPLSVHGTHPLPQIHDYHESTTGSRTRSGLILR
jgi:hypothetical protein